MRKLLMLATILVVAVGCVGVPVDQVETALKLTEAEAVTYTDLASFTRNVLQAGEKASPEAQREFWTESLKALDENVDQFARENRDLMRIIAAMKEIDPVLQQQMFDRLTDLIILAKTGKPVPEPEVE